MLKNTPVHQGYLHVKAVLNPSSTFDMMMRQSKTLGIKLLKGSIQAKHFFSYKHTQGPRLHVHQISARYTLGGLNMMASHKQEIVIAVPKRLIEL